MNQCINNNDNNDNNNNNKDIDKEIMSRLREENFNIKKNIAAYRNMLGDKAATNIKYVFYHNQFKKHLIYKFDKWLRSLDKLFIKKPPYSPHDEKKQYNYWIQIYDNLGLDDINRIHAHIATFTYKTHFTVIIVDKSGDRLELLASLASLEKQIYQDFNVVILSNKNIENQNINDFSNEKFSFDIQVARLNVDHFTTNDCDKVLSDVHGNFIILLDSLNRLSSRALYEFAVQIDLNPSLKILYSDDDEIDKNEERYAPFFKPNWDRTLFIQQNYMAQSVVFNKKEALYQLRASPDDKKFELEDMYFSIAMKSKNTEIGHIPSVLFHYSSHLSKTAQNRYARSKNITESYCQNIGLDIQSCTEQENYHILSVKQKISSPSPHVTIIIPTHNQPNFLENCLSSLISKTTYFQYDIIIIDHDNSNLRSRKLLRQYSQNENIKIMEYCGEFNFSDMMNKAVCISSGDIIVFLNDDTEIIDDEWLIELIRPLEKNDCAIVGGKLLYPNRTIQHAGVVIGFGNVAGHTQQGLSESNPGYFSNLRVEREVSAVSGACMAIRRRIFEEVGGMDVHNFKKKFNDVDLCLKVRDMGYKIIWTPYAKLVHHESVTCGEDIKYTDYQQLMSEVECFIRKWDIVFDHMYNPNLTLDGRGYELSIPPRRIHPWKI